MALVNTRCANRQRAMFFMGFLHFPSEVISQGERRGRWVIRFHITHPRVRNIRVHRCYLCPIHLVHAEGLLAATCSFKFHILSLSVGVVAIRVSSCNSDFMGCATFAQKFRLFLQGAKIHQRFRWFLTARRVWFFALVVHPRTGFPRFRVFARWV